MPSQRSQIVAAAGAGPAAGAVVETWAIPALILLWAVLVRLPFFDNYDNDEAFFALVAARWLVGGLPYVASYDIKPPGLFAIFAAAQALFGMSLATIKALEIAFVVAGALAILRLVSAHASRGAAIWAAAIYPVYSLSMWGVHAPNPIIQIPFIILAIDSVLRAIKQDQASSTDHLIRAGLLMGAAGMIKQNAIFEALAMALVLAISLRARWRALLIYGAAMAAVPVLFGVYFALAGQFREAFDAVVVSAVQRTSGMAVNNNGPNAGETLTFLGGAQRFFPLMKPALFLVGLCGLLLMRWGRLKDRIDGGLAAVLSAWVAAAVLGILAQRSEVEYYGLMAVPPLLIGAAVFLFAGIDCKSARQRAATLALITAGAVAAPLIVNRELIFRQTPINIVDALAAHRTAAALTAMDPPEGARLLVVNRGMPIYVEAGLMPPTAVFHAMHLMCAFPSGDRQDPLTAAFAARPEFVALGDPRSMMGCELPARHAALQRELAAHYALMREVSGVWDTYLIYRRKDFSDPNP